MICWDKLQPWDNFSQFELAWTPFDCPARMIRLSNTGGANAEKKIHPTQKPVKLYEWLLMNYAKCGDKIIDTHLGSASSVIACINLGFDIDGIELDLEYFEASKKRVINYLSQLNLFRTKPEINFYYDTHIE
jgi:site-specific DNA-methyltransferase (adenine-specific)